MILLTGATDGIGLALARRLAAAGRRFILTGRRPLSSLDPRLFATESYIEADLAHSDCAQTITAWLEAHDIARLEAVIHNAGLGWFGDPAQQTDESIEHLLNVNLCAPITLTHALLPRLRGGQVVFISSVASTLPTPDYALYTATKAALDGFGRNLRLELRDEVSVQVIWPGGTRTNMHAKSGVPAERLKRLAEPEAVAGQIVHALERRTSTAIGLGNQVVRWASVHFEGVVDAMVKSVSLGVEKRATVEGSAPPSPSGRGGQPKVARGEGELCAITGFADGIGRALALRFARAGYTILGIDVDGERAAQTGAELAASGARVDTVIADLSHDPGLDRIREHLRNGPPVEVFIHNAGINAVGRFAEMDVERQLAVLAINFRAPLLLTAELLRGERLAPGGSLVFISSLSRFVSYPGASVYSAAKDGLASYARSLGVALAARGQHVLTVYPGPTRTAHARRYSPDNARENRRMPPEVLADDIFRAVKRRARVLIPGTANQAFALAGTWLPGITEAAMRKSIFERLP